MRVGHQRAAGSFKYCYGCAYGPLHAELQRRGQPIGSLDTLIAAHALALGATLLTNNVEEFRRVPALTCENWV
jgi:tRNA(fMet)-specific endonuclease VapC